MSRPSDSSIALCTLETAKDTTVTNSKITIKTNRIIKKSGAFTNRKKKKPICRFDECTNISLKTIGDCNFCQGQFCAKHRIMEKQNCEGIKNSKDELHKRDAEKLIKEKTKFAKIQI